MPKRYVQGCIFLFVILTLAGCSATKGVQVRRYIQEKERLDQEMSGNAGFLYGSAPEVTTERKKSRQIYVVEVSKGPEEPALSDEVYEVGPIDTSIPDFGPSDGPSGPSQPTVTIPPIEDDLSGAGQRPSASGGVTEYTVEKDDTLQKISKKFYNSYGKWPKIYEANKDKIENPDKIEPGIVITIPAE